MATTVQKIVAFWFAGSVLVLVGARLWALNRLARGGTRVDWFWAGTPGYLEKLLESSGKRSRGALLRHWPTLLLMNMLAAALAFFLVVVMVFRSSPAAR